VHALHLKDVQPEVGSHLPFLFLRTVAFYCLKKLVLVVVQGKEVQNVQKVWQVQIEAAIYGVVIQSLQVLMACISSCHYHGDDAFLSYCHSES
jgi:hypothetical protein